MEKQTKVQPNQKNYSSCCQGVEKKVNCWKSTQKVSWYRRKLSVKKSKNFMQELIFLIRRNFTSIFLYISLGISRPRIWKWGGVVMTTFYYNSVNHQSGLQRITYIFALYIRICRKLCHLGLIWGICRFHRSKDFEARKAGKTAIRPWLSCRFIEDTLVYFHISSRPTESSNTIFAKRQIKGYHNRVQSLWKIDYYFIKLKFCLSNACLKRIKKCYDKWSTW